jgi:hypothetical protein
MHKKLVIANAHMLVSQEEYHIWFFKVLSANNQSQSKTNNVQIKHASKFTNFLFKFSIHLEINIWKIK